jgi:hypothetical protein
MGTSFTIMPSFLPNRHIGVKRSTSLRLGRFAKSAESAPQKQKGRRDAGPFA